MMIPLCHRRRFGRSWTHQLYTDIVNVTLQQHAMYRVGAIFRDLRDSGMLRLGEYVVPKAVAERMTKETTARLLRQDRITGTSTIYVGDRAAVPGAKIVKEMVEAEARIQRHMTIQLEESILDRLCYVQSPTIRSNAIQPNIQQF